LDPLDPLTEIINSGQGFSPSIALERIIWAMIGIFFLGAISRSITNSMRSQNWFGRNFLFSYSQEKKLQKIPPQNLLEMKNKFIYI
jgi:hypothetical protein